MNAPNRSDSYLLPEGAQKVAYEKDTKIANAGKFTILREDHTVGNLLRMYVLFGVFFFQELQQIWMRKKNKTKAMEIGGRALDRYACLPVMCCVCDCLKLMGLLFSTGNCCATRT